MKKAQLAGALVVCLAAGFSIGTMITRPANGQEVGTPGGRYTVVSSEGINLIVTDNRHDKLYFYAVDKGKEPGAELKLRGTLDLKKVGEKVIKPKVFFDRDGDGN